MGEFPAVFAYFKVNRLALTFSAKGIPNDVCSAKQMAFARNGMSVLSICAGSLCSWFLQVLSRNTLAAGPKSCASTARTSCSKLIWFVLPQVH